MLSSISRVYKTTSNDFGFNFGSRNQSSLPVFEKIDKHLSVLHYRNSQLRNAILAKSEDHTKKRRDQFMTVLKSYVRLIILELHQPITQASQFDEKSRYSRVREETFAGYEKLLKQSNLPCAEMLKRGSDFSRELFNIELELRQFQKMEEEVIYPLYKLAHENQQPGKLLRRTHN